MTEKELEVLSQALSQATRYLEFGTGNSTKLAVSYPNIEKIVGVESDAQFFKDVVLTDPVIQLAQQSKRLTTHCIDIGKTFRWGQPEDNQMRHLWPNYSLLPYNDFKDYDLVLVDGRFRMACALNALLNATKEFTLLIHDYPPRKQLHRLVWSGLFDVVKVVDTLGVFKPRPISNRKRIQLALEHYQYLQNDLRAFEENRMLRVMNRVLHFVTKKI
jgi:hypothetical protein